MSNAKIVYRTIQHGLKKSMGANLGKRQGNYLNVLSALVCGMLQTKSSQLEQIATGVPSRSKIQSQIMQFRRWLQNENVTYQVFYLPLIEKVLNVLSKDPIVLIIDGSETAKNCVTLMVSVAYKGRALPLMWVTREGKKGHFPQKMHIELIRAVQKIIPNGCDVVCLGDGEFDGTEWLQVLNDFGWRYVCRTAKNALCYENDDEFAMRDICPAKGKCNLVEDLEFTAARNVKVNAVAYWDKQHKEPIYWVTNVETPEEAQFWYKKRFKIETLFSDLKGRGFGIDKSHLSDPERVARLLIAVCIAYIWVVCLGVFSQNNGWDKIIHRTERCDLSLFQLGIRLLSYFLCNGQSLPLFKLIL
jgi:hypothetical protein